VGDSRWGDTRMTRRTRVSGWKVIRPMYALEGEPGIPFEMFIKGHISPEIAIKLAERNGIDSADRISIEHQITGLSRWTRHAGTKNPIQVH